MIKPFLYIVFLFSFVSSAQNLVPNGSFEEIDSCYGQPALFGMDVFNWTGCDNWQCPTNASSDLWCNNPVFGSYYPPSTALGYQNPKTGNNMAGIYTWVSHSQEYREYIQSELISPLESGKYYEISINVNLSNYTENNSSSCFQYYISDSPISSVSSSSLNVVPNWKNDPSNFVTDSVEWVQITGYVKANGGEKYLIIGCFDDSSNIIVENNDLSTAFSVYYFIDDISCSLAPFIVDVPNIFTPNSDGVNELFKPTVVGLPDFKMYIYNRWGNLMETINESNDSWDGSNAIEGTYFYVLESKETDIIEQGFFHLVR